LLNKKTARRAKKGENMKKLKLMIVVMVMAALSLFALTACSGPTHAVTWSGTGLTIAATVDGQTINSGDEVEEGSDVVFNLTGFAAYMYVYVSIGTGTATRVRTGPGTWTLTNITAERRVVAFSLIAPQPQVCDEHTFGAWIVTTAPTCTAQGVETRMCADCEETETRSIPALGHLNITDCGDECARPDCNFIYECGDCTECTNDGQSRVTWTVEYLNDPNELDGFQVLEFIDWEASSTAGETQVLQQNQLIDVGADIVIWWELYGGYYVAVSINGTTWADTPRTNWFPVSGTPSGLAWNWWAAFYVGLVDVHVTFTIEYIGIDFEKPITYVVHGDGGNVDVSAAQFEFSFHLFDSVDTPLTPLNRGANPYLLYGEIAVIQIDNIHPHWEVGLVLVNQFGEAIDIRDDTGLIIYDHSIQSIAGIMNFHLTFILVYVGPRTVVRAVGDWAGTVLLRVDFRLPGGENLGRFEPNMLARQTGVLVENRYQLVIGFDFRTLRPGYTAEILINGDAVQSLGPKEFPFFVFNADIHYILTLTNDVPFVEIDIRVIPGTVETGVLPEVHNLPAEGEVTFWTLPIYTFGQQFTGRIPYNTIRIGIRIYIPAGYILNQVHVNGNVFTRGTNWTATTFGTLGNFYLVDLDADWFGHQFDLEADGLVITFFFGNDDCTYCNNAPTGICCIECETIYVGCPDCPVCDPQGGGVELTWEVVNPFEATSSLVINIMGFEGLNQIAIDIQGTDISNMGGLQMIVTLAYGYQIQITGVEYLAFGPVFVVMPPFTTDIHIIFTVSRNSGGIPLHINTDAAQGVTYIIDGLDEFMGVEIDGDIIPEGVFALLFMFDGVGTGYTLQVTLNGQPLVLLFDDVYLAFFCVRVSDFCMCDEFGLFCGLTTDLDVVNIVITLVSVTGGLPCVDCNFGNNPVCGTECQNANCQEVYSCEQGDCAICDPIHTGPAAFSFINNTDAEIMGIDLVGAAGSLSENATVIPEGAIALLITVFFNVPDGYTLEVLLNGVLVTGFDPDFIFDVSINIAGLAYVNIVFNLISVG